MATKKHNFAKVTEKALRRPKSMGDFLSNDDEAPVGIADEQGRVDSTETMQSSSDYPNTDVSSTVESISTDETVSSLPLSEQTTFYLDLQVCEILDSLWINLRKKAPKGRKKRISKSLIVNRMVEFCNEILEKDGLDDSKLVEMILAK